MWKLKFFMTIFAMMVTCIMVPFWLYYDYLAKDWFLMSIDIGIAWMWCDYLWRTFKGQT